MKKNPQNPQYKTSIFEFEKKTTTKSNNKYNSKEIYKIKYIWIKN